MLKNRGLFKLISVAFSMALPFFANATPSNFIYQGQIIKSNGNPLSGNPTTFIVQIISPGTEACVLYEERHMFNMSNSEGVFSLAVGTGARSGTDYEDISNLVNVFKNNANFTSLSRCATGSTYAPLSLADPRKLRLTYNDGSGDVTVAQDHNIQSVPFAWDAKTIDGLAPANFVQINAITNITQAKMETLFSGTNYNKLLGFADGTTPVVASGVNGAAIPSFTVDPTSPPAGSMWVNTTTNEMKFNSGSGVQVVGSGGGTGDISAVTTTAPLLGGATSGAVALTIDYDNSSIGLNGSSQLAVRTGGVGSSQLASDAVTTSKILDANVTNAKILSVDVDKITSLATKYFSYMPNAIECANNGILRWDATNDRWTCGTETAETGDISSVVAGTGLTGGATSGVATLDVDIGTAPAQFQTNSAIPNCAANQKLQMTLPPVHTWSCVDEYTPAKIADIDGNTQIQVEESANEDIIRFDTAGTERMIIGATGNVGIGTASPTKKIEILDNMGTVEFSNTAADNNRSTFLVTGSENTNAPVMLQLLSKNSDAVITAARSIDLRFMHSAQDSSTAVSSRVTGRMESTGATATDVSGSLVFTTKPAGTASSYSRLKIDSTGNVGIGLNTFSGTAATNADDTLHIVNNTGANALQLPFRLQNGNATNGTTSVGLAFKNDTTAANTRYKSGIAFERLTTNGRGTLHFLMNDVNDTSNVALTDSKLSIAASGSVGIGTATPTTSAILDVASTSKGVLFPRMTQAQRDAILSPTTGLMVFNSDVNQLQIRRPSSWEQVGTGTASGSSATTSSYVINTDSDNAGSDGGVNVQTNSSTVAQISSAGLFRAGTGALSTPALSFMGDPDTGIHNTAANTLSLVSGGVEGLRVNTIASGVNYVAMTPSITGNGPVISTAGSDTNINLNITPKGTGTTNFTSGNVGIGTTTPQLRAEIKGITGAPAVSGTVPNGIARFSQTGAGVLDVGVISGGTGAWLQSTRGNDLSIYDALLLNPNGGFVGIGTTTVPYMLSLSGSSNRTIGMERISTDSNGRSLTVVSGGAFSGGTDRSGGALVLSSGISTGLGSSIIQFQTAPPGSAGTADNAPSTKMTIDGAGGVGIGIATPTSRIHGVTSLSAATGNEIAYSLDYTTNKATSGNDTGLLIKMTDTLSPGVSLPLDIQVGGSSRFNVDNSGAVSATNLSVAGNGNTAYATSSVAATDPIQSGSTAALITSSNYSGVDSYGSYFMSTVRNTSGNTQKAYMGAVSNTGAGVYTPSLVFGHQTGANAYNERMRIDASGYVGIGAASPQALLEVSGTQNGQLQAMHIVNTASAASGRGPRIGFQGNGNTNMSSIGSAWEGATSADAALVFSTRGTGTVAEQMRITSTGSVGIGAPVPGAKLDVAGTVKLGASGGVISSMGTCSIVSTAWTTAPTTSVSCIGVPSATAIVSCSPGTPQTGQTYAVKATALNTVTVVASTTGTTTLSCYWVQP